MRQSGRQLGAITAEARLEYFLPSSIADAIAGKGNYAFCMDADDLLRTAMIQASAAGAKATRAMSERSRIENLRNYGYDEAVIVSEAKKREARAKRQGKTGDAFIDLATTVQKEIAQLRSKGVKGVIPVCINRSSGKRGKELPRFHRRANAIHERFHADVRRVEADAGVDKFSCYKRLDELTAKYMAGNNLRYHSLSRFAQMKSKLATEELLARVEEVRSACRTKRRAKDCEDTLMDIVKYMPEPEGFAFIAMTQGVEKDYGTPLNVVRAAVRSCKVP
jgi:hypothetical protein